MYEIFSCFFFDVVVVAVLCHRHKVQFISICLLVKRSFSGALNVPISSTKTSISFVNFGHVKSSWIKSHCCTAGDWENGCRICSLQLPIPCVFVKRHQNVCVQIRATFCRDSRQTRHTLINHRQIEMVSSDVRWAVALTSISYLRHLSPATLCTHTHTSIA